MVQVLYISLQHLVANSGKSKTALLRIFFSWNIARQTRFFINGRGNYLSLQANELSNQGWGAMVNGGLQQSFKYDWSLALNLFYVTAPIKLQGQGSQFLNYGLSVSKLFFNKRFTVMARVTNPFTPYTIFGENRIGTSFSQDSYTQVYRQLFGVRLSYRFGDLKSSVKRVQKNENSGEQKETSLDGVLGE